MISGGAIFYWAVEKSKRSVKKVIGRSISKTENQSFFIKCRQNIFFDQFIRR